MGRDREWVTDSELEALTLERTINPTESDPRLTQRIFDENAPAAAKAIAHLAMHSHNDHIKLKAAQYIVERSIGKTPDSNFRDGREGKKDVFEELYDVVVRDASAAEASAIAKARGGLYKGK